MWFSSLEFSYRLNSTHSETHFQIFATLKWKTNKKFLSIFSHFKFHHEKRWKDDPTDTTSLLIFIFLPMINLTRWWTYPNVHSLVIAANLIKEIFVNGEKAAGHCRWSQRSGFVIVASFHFTLWYTIPSEIQFPIKAAPCLIRRRYIFKCIIGNDIDDWAHNGGTIDCDSR